MTYTIICDSCTDISREDQKDSHFVFVPLTLQIGDYFVVDDDDFDQLDFIERVANSKEGPKTACPSPGMYLEAYRNANTDMVFVITLSQHLSGSYNSAMVAKEMYEEEYGTDKKIKVISSDSAASGQANLALAIREWAESGMEWEELCERIDDQVYHMKTYFVLESLEVLRKNGRLSGLSAFFATALNIKPVMGAEHGVIIKLDQARGINKALNRMVDIVMKEIRMPAQQARLCISHCNCPERALYVKNLFEKRANFREIYIADARGVSTVYESDGGIVVAV